MLIATPSAYKLTRGTVCTRATSLAMLSRKSETAAAIHYALSLWPAMVRYVDDGRIEIDNSAAERSLRGR